MFGTVSHWMTDNKYHCSISYASPGLISCQRAGKSRIICKYEYYWGRNEWCEFTNLPPKRVNRNTQSAVLEAPPSSQILTGTSKFIRYASFCLHCILDGLHEHKTVKKPLSALPYHSSCWVKRHPCHMLPRGSSEPADTIHIYGPSIFNSILSVVWLVEEIQWSSYYVALFWCFNMIGDVREAQSFQD